MGADQVINIFSVQALWAACQLLPPLLSLSHHLYISGCESRGEAGSERIAGGWGLTASLPLHFRVDRLLMQQVILLKSERRQQKKSPVTYGSILMAKMS